MENEAKITEIKALKGRTVAKLKTGFKHYFAYERKKKLTKKWSNAEVLEWAEQEGFSDYVKILQR
jgi:inorganic pyrophosphatase